MDNTSEIKYKLINVDNIDFIPNTYPEEFINFCKLNNLKPPIISSLNGKALSVMLSNLGSYWNRDTCDLFVKKFNLSSKDSIQLFNKHSQWGIMTNSGIEKGRLYIIYPYKLSNKHKMRKGFNSNISKSDKSKEVDKIKSTIINDYIDIPNDKWQLGHKNPDSIDNTYSNLVIQPPIQGKYRDDYIFIDTITKLPLPNKLKNMYMNGDIFFTEKQIDEYIEIFNSFKYKIDLKFKQNLDDNKMNLEKMSKKELLDKCDFFGIKKCKSKTKEELILLLNKYEEKKISKDIDNKSCLGVHDSQNIYIINSDCMTEITKLEDNSLDCIITDPPYFIDKLDNKWSSDNVNNDIKNSHIKHLPKGMKFDKKQVKNLYDYYLELSKLLINKLKPGGYFLSFSSPRLYHAIAMSCEIAGFEIRDMINWNYTQSMPKGMSISHIIEKMDIEEEEKEKLKEQYKEYKTPQIRSCFEPICVAMKPLGKLTFIQNELKFKTGLLDFSQKVGINNDRVPANIITTEEYNDTYDKNFLISKPTKNEKGENNTHITVKPVILIEHLIKLFSKEDSLILDPFLGSGTTALACKNTNRKCIGIEINEEYYNIALSRCK